MLVPCTKVTHLHAETNGTHQISCDSILIFCRVLQASPMRPTLGLEQANVFWGEGVPLPLPAWFNLSHDRDSPHCQWSSFPRPISWHMSGWCVFCRDTKLSLHPVGQGHFFSCWPSSNYLTGPPVHAYLFVPSWLHRVTHAESPALSRLQPLLYAKLAVSAHLHPHSPVTLHAKLAAVNHPILLKRICPNWLVRKYC